MTSDPPKSLYKASNLPMADLEAAFGGKSKIKLNGKSYCWLAIDVKNRKIIGTEYEENAVVFSIKGNINTDCVISCNVQGLTLYWIWKRQDSDIGLESWNEEKKSQYKFQISTSCGESHIKFTCNKNGLQRPLKLSKTMKTLYYSKGQRNSDIKVPLKNAPTDQKFLILVDPKIEHKSGLISAQNHADLSLENKKMLNYSILKAESQCEKSGAYLNMIGSIRKPIRENPVVELSNESEIHEEEDLSGNILETENNDKNLYTWNTTDKIQIDENLVGSENLIKKLTMKYLKSLKIFQVYGKPFFNFPTKKLKTGTHLYWIKSVEELDFVAFINCNVTLVLPMKLLMQLNLKNFEDIRNWVNTQISQTVKMNVMIKSTYRLVCLNDLVIVSVTKLQCPTYHKSRNCAKRFNKFRTDLLALKKEKTSQAVELKLALENIEKQFELKLESKICKVKNDVKAESTAAMNQMKIEIQNHFKLKLEQETEELKTENTARLVKVIEKLDEAKSEIAILKAMASKMKNHDKDLQLRQKDLVLSQEDLKNSQQSLDISKYEIKKEIVFEDMTIHFEENETSDLKRKLPSMESPPKKKSCLEVQNEDFISRKLRKISRKEEARRKIMATKTLKEYWNVKALLIEELKKDFRQSKILKLNVNGQRAPLDTCGYYQRKICKDLGLKHLQGNRKNMLRYHICDFCYELLNQANLHAAAECTIFKELDDE